MVNVASGIDEGLIWHCGNPAGEGRAMAAGNAVVRLDNRDIFQISGPDRLTWLHSLTTQFLTGLAPGQGTTALILSANGRIKHSFSGIDDGQTLLAWTESEHGKSLIDWLDSMRFMLKVEVKPRNDLVLWWAGNQVELPANSVSKECDFTGREVLLPRDIDLDGIIAGTWALEAMRIAYGIPRIFIDTDEHTIPNEIGLYGTHLEKGCYPGQETVARIQTLGRPARRLVQLFLDGTMDMLPSLGADISYEGRKIGFVGSAALHYELGPIALGLIKRNVPVEATLLVDGIPANQTVLVDPDVGLHFKAKL